MRLDQAEAGDGVGRTMRGGARRGEGEGAEGGGGRKWSEGGEEGGEGGSGSSEILMTKLFSK